jgi:hypothetical protein
VTVHWQHYTEQAQIVEYLASPYPDLALLRLSSHTHPCVYLCEDIQLGDNLYSFGYSDVSLAGDSVTLEYEGPSGAGQPLFKLKEGQVRPGVSGAPLLNLRTGGVCGVVRISRDRNTDLGGRAIPTQELLARFRALTGQQEQFHRQNGAWLECLTPQQQHYIPWRTPAVGNPFYGDSPHLLGRDEEVQRIAEKLRAGNHCSIVGPPGSGKSYLLRIIQQNLPSWLGSQGYDVLLIPCRSVANVRELQDLIVHHLGGQKVSEWRSLFRFKPLRLLILDDRGGMDPGARGLEMRRWLRGLDDAYRTKLLMVSNERLDVLFRKDDSTRDSPLAGLDPVPVVLAPLPSAVCRLLVQQRLDSTTLDIAQFTDLLAEPRQPRQLLELCAARYEALHRGH